MPQRWGIWFAIEGNLRFLSHHETIRAIERVATRADLPLRYTQGFNPHPVCSLPCPRPVAVASADELLVVSLQDDQDEPQPGQAEQLVESLNRQAPRGMKFLRAKPMQGKAAPQPIRITCELPLDETQVPMVRQKLQHLRGQSAWHVDRTSGPARSGRRRVREIDIKPMIDKIEIDRNVLRFAGVTQEQRSARPGEVLSLVGLDARGDLAQVRRTGIEYNFGPDETQGAGLGPLER